MTEPRTPFPLDIIGYIVDLLANSEDDRDTKSLQILSQTCKTVLPLCRKHLFSTLMLLSQPLSERLSDLLSRRPELVRYVKNLSYVTVHSVTDHELKIFDLLKNHSSLRSIVIISNQMGDSPWTELPEPLQSSLVPLIQLPTLTRLKIRNFSGFPSTALALCSNIIDLQLEEVDIAPPDASRSITRSKIPTPKSLSVTTISYNGLAVLMASMSPFTVGPIIDFSRLERAIFDVASQDDIVQLGQLIKMTAPIKYLFITLEWPVSLAGIGQSLTVNAYRTLTLLGVNITAMGDDYDPMCGLNRELKCIAKNNILEELELEIRIETDAPCNTEFEDWSAFDSLLTDPGAFPMLRRVSVRISWYLSGRGVDEVDTILASLTKERFPRLVESSAVKFKFCINTHSTQ